MESDRVTWSGRERSQMNSTAILLATCDGLLNRDLIDQGPVWVAQGTGQQQRERGAGVMLSAVCWQR